MAKPIHSSIPCGLSRNAFHCQHFWWLPRYTHTKTKARPLGYPIIKSLSSESISGVIEGKGLKNTQAMPFSSSADSPLKMSSISTHSLDDAVSASTIMPAQPTIPFEHMKLADAFTQVASLSNTNNFNASARMAMEQRHTIRLLASSTSVFSILAATCAVYWFYMMRRNFRRDLVLLLIMGDFWKSLWFLTFACITYTHERIRSESAICQVSGYMLQMGTMVCGKFFLSSPKRNLVVEFPASPLLTTRLIRLCHPLHESTHVAANLPSSGFLPRS